MPSWYKANANKSLKCKALNVSYKDGSLLKMTLIYNDLKMHDMMLCRMRELTLPCQNI